MFAARLFQQTNYASQQTLHVQFTYDAESGNRTRATCTLVGGECSHHCAIPAPAHGSTGARARNFRITHEVSESNNAIVEAETFKLRRLFL